MKTVTSCAVMLLLFVPLRASVADPAPESLVLRASAKSYGKQTKSVSLYGTTPGKVTFTGSIINVLGGPVSGATVSLLGSEKTVPADEQGHYKLIADFGGSRDLAFNFNILLRREVWKTQVDCYTPALAIPGTAKLALYVTDQDGVPGVGLKVHVTPADKATAALIKENSAFVLRKGNAIIPLQTRLPEDLTDLGNIPLVAKLKVEVRDVEYDELIGTHDISVPFNLALFRAQLTEVSARFKNVTLAAPIVAYTNFVHGIEVTAQNQFLALVRPLDNEQLLPTHVDWRFEWLNGNNLPFRWHPTSPKPGTASEIQTLRLKAGHGDYDGDGVLDGADLAVASIGTEKSHGAPPGRPFPGDIMIVGGAQSNGFPRTAIYMGSLGATGKDPINDVLLEPVDGGLQSSSLQDWSRQGAIWNHPLTRVLHLSGVAPAARLELTKRLKSRPSGRRLALPDAWSQIRKQLKSSGVNDLPLEPPWTASGLLQQKRTDGWCQPCTWGTDLTPDDSLLVVDGFETGMSAWHFGSGHTTNQIGALHGRGAWDIRLDKPLPLNNIAVSFDASARGDGFYMFTEDPSGAGRSVFLSFWNNGRTGIGLRAPHQGDELHWIGKSLFGAETNHHFRVEWSDTSGRIYVDGRLLVDRPPPIQLGTEPGTLRLMTGRSSLPRLDNVVIERITPVEKPPLNIVAAPPTREDWIAIADATPLGDNGFLMAPNSQLRSRECLSLSGVQFDATTTNSAQLQLGWNCDGGAQVNLPLGKSGASSLSIGQGRFNKKTDRTEGGFSVNRGTLHITPNTRHRIRIEYRHGDLVASVNDKPVVTWAVPERYAHGPIRITIRGASAELSNIQLLKKGHGQPLAAQAVKYGTGIEAWDFGTLALEQTTNGIAVPTMRAPLANLRLKEMMPWPNGEIELDLTSEQGIWWVGLRTAGDINTGLRVFAGRSGTSFIGRHESDTSLHAPGFRIPTGTRCKVRFRRQGDIWTVMCNDMLVIQSSLPDNLIGPTRLELTGPKCTIHDVHVRELPPPPPLPEGGWAPLLDTSLSSLSQGWDTNGVEITSSDGWPMLRWTGGGKPKFRSTFEIPMEDFAIEYDVWLEHGYMMLVLEHPSKLIYRMDMIGTATAFYLGAEHHAQGWIMKGPGLPVKEWSRIRFEKSRGHISVWRDGILRQKVPVTTRIAGKAKLRFDAGNAKFALANLKISQWRPTKPPPPSPPPAWKTDFTKGSLSGWTDAWLPGATFSGEGIIFTSEFSAGKTLWSLRQIPLFNVELAFRIRGQEPLILLDSDEGIGYAVILDRFVNFACGTPRASLPYMHLAKYIKWDPKAWYHVVLRFKGDKLTVLRDGKLIAEGQIPAQLLCNGRVGIGCRGRREMTLKDFGMRPLSKTAPPPVKTPTSAAVVKKPQAQTLPIKKTGVNPPPAQNPPGQNPPIQKPTIKDPVKMIKPPTRKSIVITRLNSLNRNIVAEITYGVHAQGTVASVRLFGPGSTKPLQRMQIIVSTAGKKTCTFREPMMGWKPGPYTCDVTIDEKPVTSKTILYGK